MPDTKSVEFEKMRKTTMCKVLIALFVIMNTSLVFISGDAKAQVLIDAPTISEVQTGSSILSKVLLWIPNRIIDLLDVVHIDVGVGPSFGAVVRATDSGQVGYRVMSPASLRAGLNGRNLPIFIERGMEVGMGPTFVNSFGRDVCPGELGAGVDLFLLGGYGGICFDEALDFVVGIFGFDMMEDDWE